MTIARRVAREVYDEEMAFEVLMRERAAARETALEVALAKVEFAGMKHTAATLRHLIRWLREGSG